MRLLLALIFVGGCFDTDTSVDFYNHAESGTIWRLEFSQGRPIASFAGECPNFATREMQLPNTNGTQCDTGCTCSFSLVDDSEGEIAPRDTVTLHFAQACSDGSRISVDQDVDPSNLTFAAYWRSVDSPSSLGDCSYDLTLTEVM